ncbi:Hemin receptor [Vibrio stylophorae]|uniref:Hemin receptor n=1 Tax=Vibrio stylophorae TaxID=659351 RepID=A0ABM8ZS39_9VIBR|nr:TonB-dependent receptor [Vibrio stylophorae]CAH0533106.1 Hemin receptor [Vibrio stylophorae]
MNGRIYAALVCVSTCLPSYASTTNCENNEQQPCETNLITVTANRFEMDIAKYAGSVGVMEASELKQDANLIKALTDIPGFDSSNDLGRQIGSQYTIRGFGSFSDNRVIVRRDGVPLSSNLFSNHISTFRSDSDLLKRVEVVKGTSSILYGSGAIGGIVLMESKNADDFLKAGEQFGATLGQRFESNNMSSTRFSVAGDLDALPVDFVLYGKTSTSGDIALADGGVPGTTDIHNDENIDTLYFKGGWDIDAEKRLEFSVYDFDEKLDAVWQNLFHSNLDEYYVGHLEQQDWQLRYLQTSLEHQLIHLSAGVYYSDASYDRHSADMVNDPRWVTYRNEEKRWGANIQNVSLFDTGRVGHELLIGFEYAHREEDAIYQNAHGISDFGSMPNEYNDYGLYVLNTMTINDWQLTLGGRYDDFDREVKRHAQGSYSDSNFSPRAALAYEPVQGLTLLAGYAQSFRAPTPHETSSEGPLNPHYYYLPNYDLKAEKGEEYELGFSYESDGLITADDRLFFKAIYFDGKIKDMISLKRLPGLGTPPSSNEYAQYQNVDNATRQGVEIMANYWIGDWQIDASFETLDVEDEVTGLDVDQAFADKVMGRVSYIHQPWQLQLGVQVNHWFAPDQDFATTISGGQTYTYVDQSFTQVNVAGSWDFTASGSTWLAQNAMLYFGVNNLFDQQYINAGGVNESSRVGQATNYYLDLEVQF